MNCEQRVEIIKKNDESVWVRPVLVSLCATCAPSGKCRADWLSGFSNAKKTFEIPLDAPISSEIGDQVSVLVDSAQLTLAIVRLYGLPLSGLLVAASIGMYFGWTDRLTLLVAMVGVGLGWWMARMWNNQIKVKVKVKQ